MEIKQFRPLRKPLTPEEQDQKLQNVAKLYEKQFLREMMKQMRSTVTEGGFMPANNAEKIFREQLDQEYVEKWGDRGGIGLADMIHKQLLERLGPALGIKPKPLKPIGPIKIQQQNTEASPIKILPEPQNSNVQKASAQKMTMQFDLQKAALDEDSREIVSPWSGQLLGTKQLSADEFVMEILHDDGLKSKMVFRGQPAPELRNAADLKPVALGESAQIQAGQRIGQLSPEAKSLFWTVSM